MAKKRRTDARPGLHFRSDRFVQQGGDWYFYTREGTMEGPFDGQLDAHVALDRYIRLVESGVLPEEHAFSLESWAREAG